MERSPQNNLRHLPKAVVAFAGARDGYQVPLALAEAGLLECLVTDRYFSRSFSPLLRALGRPELGPISPALPRFDVRVPPKAFIEFIAEKLGYGSPAGWRKSVAIGAQAREIARCSGAAIFSYSTSGFEALRDATTPHKFLFQFHPHPRNVRKILLEEMERTPSAASSLRLEPENAVSEEQFQLLCQESKMASGIVVASSFTAETLLANGIDEKNIHIVPYGVDPEIFREKSWTGARNGALRVAFVGSFEQRKGVSYLLEAVRHCGSKNIQLVICSRRKPAASWKPALPENCEVHVGLNRARLIQVLHTCQLLALPSLAEGFGHVILEAMSTGLPVIATPHTGARDIARDGEDAFLVPIRDSVAIAEKLDWALSNTNPLRDMGVAASRTARRFSWELFRAGIRDAYQRMVIE